MIIIFLVLIILIFLFVFLYNQIIREENVAKNAFSTVDVYLKKRYDVVPNLVSVVKGCAIHEKEVYEIVTNTRTKALEAKSTNEAVKAENEFDNALKSLFALTENYPNLKANESFLELQKSLLGLEDELAAARRTYNSAVTEYNITLDSFPTNLVGKMLNKKHKELFSASNDVRNSSNINL